MVSSEEINRRLEAKRRGIEYEEPVGRRTTNSKECPSCHTQNPSTAKFCVGCGEKLGTAEPEKPLKPEIEESELEQKSVSTDDMEEETTAKESEPKITSRPDDFGRTNQQKVIEDSKISEPPTSEKASPEKLEPIVPKSTEEKPEPVKTKAPEPPVVKQTKPVVTSTEEKAIPDADPVKRIKKAKELLDMGAITEEEFEMIKNKYLDLL